MRLRTNTGLVLLVSLIMGLTTKATCYQIYGIEGGVDTKTYTQPDYAETTFDAVRWGNSIWWEMETTTGYTIIRNSSVSFWRYAILDTNGHYVPSNYRVGIDTLGGGITTHLRRSSAAEAELQDILGDMEERIEDAFEVYDAHPGPVPEDPIVYKIGILFYAFEDWVDTTGGDSVDVNMKPYIEDDNIDGHFYNPENVPLMFTSEGEFYGERLYGVRISWTI